MTTAELEGKNKCNANFLMDKEIYRSYKALCMTKGWKVGKAVEHLLAIEIKRHANQNKNQASQSE